MAARGDQARRFQAGGFRQAPPAQYRVHPYNAPPTRLLFGIVDPGSPAWPAPQSLAARLLRGQICERHVLAYVVGRGATPYRPTRYPRSRAQAEAALVKDVQAECRRRGLPRPDVTVTDLSMGAWGGNVAAAVRLVFRVAVRGPILLGRDCHRDGGGLFRGDATS
ncbi:hypothetical protein [Roseospira visakhapatnamensis]|uniref:Uncharacterized protein n=1 Tax=Roseospira visakhapatnamensis TaxID=390880 RepID=A0A7W6RC54_9PROT|nr:hypothetical protein [Roseospira visakhapatnamensis]MBB4265426.1 hypothetical protein [Roseospira visakhapatnamensis]